MLRMLAICVGIILILSGVLGFLPEFIKDGRLFGIFEINSLRNIIHIAVGLLGILAGIKSSSLSKFFFIGMGLVFLAMAVTGIYHSTGEIFYYVVANSADNWLYAALAALFLYIGFTYIRK